VAPSKNRRRVRACANTGKTTMAWGHSLCCASTQAGAKFICAPLTFLCEAHALEGESGACGGSKPGYHLPNYPFHNRIAPSPSTECLKVYWLRQSRGNLKYVRKKEASKTTNNKQTK
jgi:hypothetical protein